MPSGSYNVKKTLPNLGVGLGLRKELAAATFAHIKEIDWLEVTPENFVNTGSTMVDILEIAASRFPLVSHSVSLSLGSSDDLSMDFLRQLKSFLDAFSVHWWSDHVSYSGADGLFLHELLPLPRSKRLVKHIAERVKRAQDFVGRPMIVENISYYMDMPGSEMTESEFISSLAEEADCGLLLDLNNIVVNSKNHKFDPAKFVLSLPLERVVQIHMAGHTPWGTRFLDTHGEKIEDLTYDLLRLVLKNVQVNAVMIERDQNFPPFPELLTELARIRSIYREYQGSDPAQEQFAAQQDLTPIVIASASDETDSVFGNDTLMPSALEGQLPTYMTESTEAQDSAPPKTLTARGAKVIDFTTLETALSRHWLLKKPLPKHLVEKVNQTSSELYSQVISNTHASAIRLMYPATASLLQKDWSKLVLDFINEYPPTIYKYSSFGNPFAEFLGSRSEITERLPYIVELAVFERTKFEVSESIQNVVVEPFKRFKTEEELRQLQPILNPVMALKSFAYPVIEIAAAAFGKGCAQPVEKKTSNLAILRDPVSKRCQVAQLSENATKIILALMHKKLSYADLIDQFVTRSGDADLVKGTVTLLDLFTSFPQLRIFVGSRPVSTSGKLPRSKS